MIIVYDNDAGARGIRNAIKNASNVMPGNEPFIQIVKNLYGVPTPVGADTPSSTIEDFFDAATKAMVFDGKTFNDGNDFDLAKHFGKKVFAHRVVRPKAETLDFTGFRPLLTNLVAAISKHKAPIAPPAGAP